MHHLDGAAGKTEGHRPERAAAGPVEKLVGLSDDEALFVQLVADSLQDSVLVGTRRKRAKILRSLHNGSHSHSSAPLRHS